MSSPQRLARGAGLALALASVLLAIPAHARVPADSLVPVLLRFRADVNGAPFQCGTAYAAVGTTRASIVASDFRFYIHDVRLVTAAGDTVRAALKPEAPWADADVALLDFEDGTQSCRNGTPERREHVVVLAPPGRYRGVAFTLGVPFARNHGDLAASPPPLSLSQLFWAWQSGHKFLRIDMRASQGDSAATPWVIHLGSTGCVLPDSTAKSPVRCLHPNRAEVALAGFDPAADVVVADLGRLLARSDVRQNQPRTAMGCMSGEEDRDCGGLFASLGLAHPAATGADTPRFFGVARGAATRPAGGP
jgi:uncharacterized repeat protein (TIGR04052 family)